MCSTCIHAYIADGWDINFLGKPGKQTKAFSENPDMQDKRHQPWLIYTKVDAKEWIFRYFPKLSYIHLIHIDSINMQSYTDTTRVNIHTYIRFEAIVESSQMKGEGPFFDYKMPSNTISMVVVSLVVLWWFRYPSHSILAPSRNAFLVKYCPTFIHFSRTSSIMPNQPEHVVWRHMDTFCMRIIVLMRNRYDTDAIPKRYDTDTIPIRYRYDTDITKLGFYIICLFKSWFQQKVTCFFKKTPFLNGVHGVQLLGGYPPTPPCLEGRTRLYRLGQIVGFVSLFFVFGIRFHALHQPPSHSAKRFDIRPLKELALGSGAFEVQPVLVLVWLGQGQDEGQVAVAAHVGRGKTVGSSHVDRVQGVSDLVQIEVRVVHAAGHITLGVIVQSDATIVLPQISFLGGDFVVHQGFVTTRTGFAWLSGNISDSELSVSKSTVSISSVS